MRVLLLIVLLTTAARAADVAPLTFADGAQLFLLGAHSDPALVAQLEEQHRRCTSTTSTSTTSTTTSTTAEACRVRGLLGTMYARDQKAAALALDLYARTGTIAGVLPELDMDGAYRGQLHLVPTLPIGAERRHLELASAALFDLDDFFHRLGGDVAFRWRPLGLRFFESVKRRTPSAFAVGWTVSYNVRGSLFTTPTRVRETFFHEVFHLNDQARGDWSAKALSSIYDRIVAVCGQKTACLTPWAPDGIKVRGGTYYAFMPDNGVREYAADLAKRWYIEHRAVLHGERVRQPFKCGKPENAAAWKLLVDEFFGGIDRVPACG